MECPPGLDPDHPPLSEETIEDLSQKIKWFEWKSWSTGISKEEKEQLRKKEEQLREEQLRKNEEQLRKNEELKLNLQLAKYQSSGKFMVCKLKRLGLQLSG